MTVITWPHPAPSVSLGYAAVTLPAVPAGGGWYNARVVENGALVLLGTDAAGWFVAAVKATPAAAWVVSPAVNTGADYFTDVCFGNGAYIASQNMGNTTRAYMRVVNPADAWTKYTIGGVTGGASAIGFGNGFFVCAASNGNWSARSFNGVVWTTQLGLSAGLRYAMPAWDGAKYIQPTSGGVNIGAAFSADGLTWTGTASAGFATCRSFVILANGNVALSIGGSTVVRSNVLALVSTLETGDGWAIVSDGAARLGAHLAVANALRFSVNGGTTSVDYPIATLIGGNPPASYEGASGGVFDAKPVVLFANSVGSDVAPHLLTATVVEPGVELLPLGDSFTGIIGREKFPFVIGVVVPENVGSVNLTASFGGAGAGYADFYLLTTSAFSTTVRTYLGWVDFTSLPSLLMNFAVAGPGTYYIGVDPYISGAAELNDLNLLAVSGGESSIGRFELAFAAGGAGALIAANFETLFNMATSLRAALESTTNVRMAADYTVAGKGDVALAAGFSMMFADTGELDLDAVLTPQKVAAMVDTLVGALLVENANKALLVLAAAGVLRDAMVSGAPMNFADQGQLIDAIEARAFALLELAMAGQLSDTMEPLLRLSLLVSDGAVAAVSGAHALRMLADLGDGAVGFVSMRLGNTEYSGWVMNVDAMAPSRYENYPFESFATFKGMHLGAGPGGIIRFAGNTDAGAPIPAWLRTFFMDFGTMKEKRTSDVYIGATKAGQLVVKTVTFDRGTGTKFEDWYAVETLPNSELGTGRAKIGQGIRSTWWQYVLHNKNGSDFELEEISFRPVFINRSV